MSSEGTWRQEVNWVFAGVPTRRHETLGWFSISGSGLVPSHFSRPHPAAFYSVTTRVTCLPCSSTPICSDPWLSPHQLMTSLHLRLHRPRCCGPVRWSAPRHPGWLGVTPATMDQALALWPCRGLQDRTAPCLCLAVHHHLTGSPYDLQGYGEDRYVLPRG